MTEQQRKQILVETVKRDAIVYDSYPTTGEPTLEFKVNYIPLFERKSIKEFALSAGNLADKFTVVDKNGNPVE